MRRFRSWRVGLGVFIAISAQSAELAHRRGARRLPGETYESISARRTHEFYFRAGTSAESQAKPVSEWDLTQLPAYATDADLKAAFFKVRDARFLTDARHPEFLRRISWLYPDDGCFNRAELMRLELVDAGAPVVPAKVFIFGNLKVDTANSPAGYVEWWYHVAPVARVGEASYVFDPAIDPAGPLKLEDWALKQAPALANVKIAICRPETYEPDDDCFTPNDHGRAYVTDSEQSYLSDEWDRMVDLSRDPKRVLGDEPPWLAPAAL